MLRGKEQKKEDSGIRGRPDHIETRKLALRATNDVSVVSKAGMDLGQHPSPLFPVVVVSLLIACGVGLQLATAQAPTSSDEAEDQSFYLDKPVLHPERLSGIWEAKDPRGGAIGIQLIFMATAPVDATTLVGVEQAWQSLEVGVYHRAGAALQFGEENFFSDSLRGGSVRYEGERLTLHLEQLDLDLLRTTGDEWSGRVHRMDFNAHVTLIRPGSDNSVGKAWFVGTWASDGSSDLNCLHIVEPVPGQFAGWSDTLQLMGLVHFAPNVSKPAYALEHYGELAKVRLTENGNAAVELYAYTGMCCPHPFVGSPADDGAVMNADWPDGPNQAPHKSEWRKVDGDSCIVAAR
jgi:hypothetical protein